MASRENRGASSHEYARKAIGLPLPFLAVIAWCVLAALGVPPRATAAECVNESIRVAQKAQNLGECRAYELVSPPGSAPSPVGSAKPVAAENGERFAYFSWNPYVGEGSETLLNLSVRSATGWTTQTATPPQGGLRSTGLTCNPGVYYSSELTRGVLADGFREGELTCDGDEPPLVDDEARGVANLFLWDPESANGYELIDPQPVSGGAEDAFLVDATPSLSAVVFSDTAPLTAAAPSGGLPALYEWSAGVLHLVSVLPGQVPAEGELAGGHPYALDEASYTHAVSSDGERVFFYHDGALYARVNALREPSSGCGEAGKACTVQIDEVAGGEGPSGGGKFLDASEDGSRVFFTDTSRLTGNATATPAAPDLYEYDTTTGVLSDLTADGSEPPADVLEYAGAAANGSRVYFTAKGVLAAANSEGDAPVMGKPNLYVRGQRGVTFIATLNEGEASQARVSPNGQYLALASNRALTGDESIPLAPEDCGAAAPCGEIFLYDAATERLACVSCAPAVRAAGQLRQTEPATFYLGPDVMPRSVLDNGEVFFDTRTALVAQAKNSKENVYEYRSGVLSLISTGVSEDDSEFLAASASGNDVFFTTAQGLVPRDKDNAPSVYDARVDGGFEGGEPLAEVSCEGVEECKGALTAAPGEVVPGSLVFSGPEDTAPAQTRETKHTQKPRKATQKRSKAKRKRGGNKRARSRGNGSRRCPVAQRTRRHVCKRRSASVQLAGRRTGGGE